MPKSCKGVLTFPEDECTLKLNLIFAEMEEDKHLDARHAIEEAMSELP